MKKTSTWVALAILMAVVVGNPAEAAHRRVRATPGLPGPAHYHELYKNINQTKVTIENFTLRTDDGKVIAVDSKGLINVDLNNLVKPGFGIEIDTRNSSIADGEIVNVVEIESTVVLSDPPYINFQTQVDGKTQCPLSGVPKKLNFYTLSNANNGQGIPMTLGKDDLDVYRLKVDFSALNAIQLDYVTVSIQDGFPCDCMDKIFGAPACHPSKPKRTGPVLRCEMVNRRLPIIDIVRKRDDF